MESKPILIENIRRQRDILNHVLHRLEKIEKAGLTDYAVCEEAAAHVGKKLDELRRFCIDSFVKEKLWGREEAAA